MLTVLYGKQLLTELYLIREALPIKHTPLSLERVKHLNDTYCSLLLLLESEATGK